MTYTDGVHLVANTLEELHQFAQQIGLKRRYFEGVRKGHPHYDLIYPRQKQTAIAHGAKLVNSRDIVRMFQNGELGHG